MQAVNKVDKQLAPAGKIHEALQAMVTDQETDPQILLIQLTKSLQPRFFHLREYTVLYWDVFMDLLKEESLRNGLRDTILRLFSSRRQVSFYTDSGLLPDTGFFSELGRILTQKILPELRDTHELKNCVAELFPRPVDQRWISLLPAEKRNQLWMMLDFHSGQDADSMHAMVQQMLEAARILSHRVAAMGLMPELARVYPRLLHSESPFMAMNIEVSRFVESFHLALEGKSDMDHGEHAFVLLAQCEETLRKIHLSASRMGTSMSLSFTLRRMEQHLERLHLLMRFMTVKVDASSRDDLNLRWSEFMLSAVDGERQRNSLRRHCSDLMSLMALRVTDNAARSGEHYIASTRSEWFSILYRAAGAGVLIALLAFLKIESASLSLGPSAQAWLNGLIYAGGFTIIYMLHFVIATKQPAMTAATLAGSISQSTGRLRDKEKVVDLMADTFRTQLAAVAGNIMVAFPLAMILLFAFNSLSGHSVIGSEKAHHLLQDVRPLMSLALLYAAVAGVWLFSAGLVSGYLDNRAVYMQLGPRIGQLGWLRFIFGKEGANKIGTYIEGHAGGLGGNIFFGLMLGLTPLLGNFLGITLDIRHVAFASANVGYGLVALDFQVPLHQWGGAVLGVLSIGLVNLCVSFTLALWVAMRSRRLSFWLLASVIPRFFHRLRHHPGNFFLPPSSG